MIWLHAQAAYLSTRKKYSDQAEGLWNLSNIEKVYDRITNEINRNGKQRRVLTFYESTIQSIDTMEKMILNEHYSIKAQGKFMIEKRNELKQFYDRFINENNQKIEDKVALLFAPIKQWVPSFVEEYIGRNDAQAELEKVLSSKQKLIEKSMEREMREIVSELENYLIEFTRQYQYDLDSIEIEPGEIGEFKRGQINKVLKWSGVALGGISSSAFVVAFAGWGAANFWNPVGWIALGASALVGILSLFFKDRETKKWQEAKSDAKEILLENIEKLERRTRGAYKAWFYKNVTKKGKKEMLDQVSSYINGLFQISDELQGSGREIGVLKDNLNKELFSTLLRLEGFNCVKGDIKAISRDQGTLTKILVPSHWYLDAWNNNHGLHYLCGEPVNIISEDENISSLVAKALYPGEVNSNQVKIIEENSRKVAYVTVAKKMKGLCIGRKGVNIRLAKKLCNIPIEIR